MRFWSGFPANAVHKAALRSQTLLYQALQARWDENETNHRGLASRKGGVWKNEARSKSFESHWASKLKINAYYKTIKVFFNLVCMSTCYWGLPNPKKLYFSTHDMGILKQFKCRNGKNLRPEAQENSGLGAGFQPVSVLSYLSTSMQKPTSVTYHKHSRSCLEWTWYECIRC